MGSISIFPKSGRVLRKSQVNNTYTLNEQKDTRKFRRDLLNILVINRKTNILELFCNLLFCTLNFSLVFMCIYEKTHILACTCTHFLDQQSVFQSLHFEDFHLFRGIEDHYLSLRSCFNTIQNLCWARVSLRVFFVCFFFCFPDSLSSAQCLAMRLHLFASAAK